MTMYYDSQQSTGRHILLPPWKPLKWKLNVLKCKFLCITSQRLKAGKLKTKTKLRIKILHQVDLTRIKQAAILTKWLVCKRVYNPRITSWVQNAHLTNLSKTFLPYSSSKWLKSWCREVNKINLFHEGSLQLTDIYFLIL